MFEFDKPLISAMDSGADRREIERAFGPEAGRWAAEQRELRERGRAKFGDAAARMLFVREALEQATPLALARYHASRFPTGAFVQDLTAGIGADLIALAERGPVVGYELDPERAACTRHNLAAFAVSGEVAVADSLASEPGEHALADPARRSGGRRVVDAEEYAPPLSRLAARARRLMGIKLSPLLPDSVLEGLEGSLEFVSFGGECREALVWLGEEAEPGRWAVRVGETVERLRAGQEPPTASEPGEFLYDADPAAVRAHALGGFGLAALGDSPGYLTGGERDSTWLRRYRVLATGGFDAKRVRAELRRLGQRAFEVKRRGVPDDADAKARSLIEATEGEPVSIVLYRVGKSVRYLLAEAA